MAGDAAPQVWEGSLRYAPVLGLEPAADGESRRARLANTVLTADGESITVVFRGDRAEVAERLLVRGSLLRMVGAWDESRLELLVDRFDVDGIVDEHRYRLTGPPVGEVAAEVDVGALYETADEAVDGWPEGPPAPPSEEFANQTPGSPRSSAVGGPPTTDRRQATAAIGFAPGQRVTARDRGNVGTVVSADDASGQVKVRFAGRNGTTAVISFAPEQLELRRSSASASSAGRPPGASAENGRGPVEPQPAETRPAKGAGHEQAPATTAASGSTPAASARGRAAATSGFADGREPGAAKKVPMTAIGVLRVHTRRPEPTGEILL